MRTSVSVALLSLGLLACKPPPEAPTELNELAGFVFERFMDDDPRDLALGMSNLDAWLQANLDATGEGSVREGYQVSDLDPALIEAVRPELEVQIEGSVAGSSVATVSAFDVEPVARALTVEEQELVFPDSYESHDRFFEAGEDCFISQDCDVLDTRNEVAADYGPLKVATHSRSQYRWIRYGEDDDQLALLNRTWLLDPAETTGTLGAIVEIKEQLYTGVILPTPDGGSVRLGTIWVAVRLIGDLNEAIALNAMVNAMKTDGDTLEVYLQGGEE